MSYLTSTSYDILPMDNKTSLNGAKHEQPGVQRGSSALALMMDRQLPTPKKGGAACATGENVKASLQGTVFDTCANCFSDLILTLEHKLKVAFDAKGIKYLNTGKVAI